MDKWAAALTAIGGLAGIGGLIDLAMYKAEQDKLKALLEDWWLRFTDVKWSNFGRAEAELAVQILDRWAGPRLWLWKRWRFSAVVTVFVLVFTITWTLVRNPVADYGSVIFLPMIMLPPSIVALALSLSLTRFIAVSAARLCKGRLITITVFAALLSLHVVLLRYWSEVVFFSENLAMAVVAEVFLRIIGVRRPEMDLGIELPKILSLLVQKGLPEAYGFAENWRYLFSFHPSGPVAEVSWYSFKVAMDIIANGLRIVFALVFLSSFVFRPLIQEPVSRLWYGAINSDKPTFTMLFGAVGTFIAAWQVMVN
jgi:hypothetical protein